MLLLALVTSCMLLVPFVWFPLHHCSAHVAVCGHWATGTVANVVSLTFKEEKNMSVYSCRFQRASQSRPILTSVTLFTSGLVS